jgi:dipeptidyl-peptidase 4
MNLIFVKHIDLYPMKLHFLLSIVLFLSFNLVFSQNKQLAPEDLIGLNPEVLPKRLNQLKWMGQSDTFSFVKDNTLLKGKTTDEGFQTIATLDDLNAGLTDLAADSVKRFPSINYMDENQIWFTHKSTLYSYHILTRNIQVKNTFPEDAKNTDVAPQSLAMAYTIENNLWIAYNGEQFQLTYDEDKGIVNGQTVHRNEFGISKGTFWSPDGNYLAFYRMDETMVTDYPLVDIDARVAEVKKIKYPMAGMPSHHVTLGIYDLNSGKITFVKTGEPKEQYLTAVTWDPDEKSVYIGLLNRDQNHLRLNSYDVATGELMNTLFEEKNDTYVESLHPLYFIENNPEQFIWLSERNGYRHLYLYNREGQLLKQLTDGEWVVNDFLGTDSKGKMAFFSGTKDSPIERNIYSVEVRSGKIARISPDPGIHNAQVSFSGDFVLDAYSNTHVSLEYKLLNRNGRLQYAIQEESNPLKDYNLGEMTIFTLKADDGSDLYCRMIKPADFQEGVKYPVYFYVYGGPHSQLVTNSWLGGAGLFQNYMAQQGYVVFTMDNRGTSNRGVAFEQAIFRNLGTVEVTDQMRGVEYLRSLDFVDADRMGVDGWSYGGFMSISLMLKQPGVFKAGCAGGPVTDWQYYEVMYGERYMDTPETNPEGYAGSSLLNHVDNLEGRLLVIHGAMDPVVVWQHSLAFIREANKKGKQVDYFVYPNHEHGVRGRERMHLNEKIKSYFDLHLKN